MPRAESYIDLLNTFSGHIAMAEWQRERLYDEIRRRLAERDDAASETRLRRDGGRRRPGIHCGR